jgi:hypothetical protein
VEFADGGQAFTGGWVDMSYTDEPDRPFVYPGGRSHITGAKPHHRRERSRLAGGQCVRYARVSHPLSGQTWAYFMSVQSSLMTAVWTMAS